MTGCIEILTFNKDVNMNLYATYKDADVHFSTIAYGEALDFCKARKEIRGKYDICPLCQKEIRDGVIFLFFNNYKLFPNIFVHFACQNGFPNEEAVVKYLYEDYQEALEYKHWLNIGGV